MSKRKICVVVTARPSYSRVKTALTAIKDHPNLELQLVVAGSALLGRYGNAVDFIEKPVVPKTVLKCVNRAMELDLKNRYERLQSEQIEQRITLLTPREHEVMKWIIRGKSNKMIARILDISIRTVEVHRRNVIEKMEATSVVDLVQMVLRTQK